MTHRTKIYPAVVFYCDLDADAHWDYSALLDANSSTAEINATFAARNSQGDGSK